MENTDPQSRGPVLYVMVGPPGSGKSSYIRKYLPEALRISLDDLRLMLSGRPFDFRYERMVSVLGEALMRVSLSRLKEWRRDCVYDATNVSRERRTPTLAIAEEYGLPAVAVFTDTPMEVALARNRRRRRKVPEEVIERFYRLLEPPSIDEGFEEVVVVRDW